MIALQPCWTLLGFIRLAPLLILVEGQERVCHFRYLQRVFLQAYRFKTAKLSVGHAPRPLQGGVKCYTFTYLAMNLQ